MHRKRVTMIQKMFSIYDQKSGTFHVPFFKPTHGEAERDFRSAVNDPKSTLNQYPDDFDLYYLGEYDSNVGKFAPLDSPNHCLKAVQCVNPKPLQN
ncbi:MAG: nonstructural protein [Microviridae sp.]|nr:MAG: nonstructural protein [Microviridae sp.]